VAYFGTDRERAGSRQTLQKRSVFSWRQNKMLMASREQTLVWGLLGNEFHARGPDTKKLHSPYCQSKTRNSQVTA